MRSETNKNDKFINPYFISELDKDGLWIGDIAKSIGIHRGNIRKKISRGFLTNVGGLGDKYTKRKKYNSNGLEYTDYALDIETSKFLVANYNHVNSGAYFSFLDNLTIEENEMKKEIEKTPEFIKPYYIKELGKKGLKTLDLAKSLDSQRKLIIRKLDKRNFIERIVKHGWDVVPIGSSNKSNGLDCQDYALDINASKFFVAKYDNDIGDAYLAFLLQCEKIVEKLETSNNTLPYDPNTLDEPTKILFAMMKSMEQRVAEGRKFEQWAIRTDTTIQDHGQRISALEDKQKAIQDKWTEFPFPFSLKDPNKYKIYFNDMVRYYCLSYDIGFKEMYLNLYARFRNFFKVDLKTRALNYSRKSGKNINIVEYAANNGFMENLYSLAYNYCSPNKVKWRAERVKMLKS